VTFTARVTRDLKASGPKTALLGVLVLVGMYFWLPSIWKAVAGSKPAAAATPTPAAPAPSAPAAPAPAAPKALGWQDAERLRSRDELFRPSGHADLKADAFTFNGDFLPLDVEFAEMQKEPERPVAQTKAAAPAKTAAAEPPSEPAEPETPPLTLQSTLVGSGRRVAVINNRVYPEGAAVAAGGRTWTLLNVEPRRVLIDGGGRTFELTINPFTASQARQ
jgi:hypothetical protein